MLKLMKYEFRKSLFTKIVMLVALGIAQAVFLFGIAFTEIEKSPVVPIGIALLVIVTIIGLSFMGLESLLTLHKDLNTKQSYMLFMTPHSSYKIIGAKIIENAIALALGALFFMILAGIDIGILLTKLGGFKELILMVQRMMKLDIDWNEVLQITTVVFCEGVLSWFSMILTGYLAIAIATALLAGKKISGFVAFLFYLLLVFVQGRVAYLVLINTPASLGIYADLVSYSIVTFVFAILFYFITCMMLEKKLNV